MNTAKFYQFLANLIKCVSLVVRVLVDGNFCSVILFSYTLYILKSLISLLCCSICICFIIESDSLGVLGLGDPCDHAVIFSVSYNFYENH